MKYAVAGADVREEIVSQALPFGGALYQSGNVHYVQESGNFTRKTKYAIKDMQ
jgi:hypothetical protein